MTDVKLPDGSIARFPDGTSPEVMKAAIQKKFPPQRNVSGPPDERVAAPASVNPVMDYASQGLSGFNEGLANIAGFPVDAVTLGMNAGSAGINKLFGTDLPQIQNPALGSEQIKQMMAPTIAPPSQGQGQQIVRRIGQELGATALPGMGPAMRSLRPLEVMGKELLTAGGSGLGAGLAEQVAPDNPVAEFAGQVAGGATVGGGLRALERDASRTLAPKAAEIPTPTVDDLRDVKNAAYKTVDDQGIRYTGDAYKKFMDGLSEDVLNQNISEKRHSAALDLINEMDTSASKRNGISMGALDDLRQVAYRDLVKSQNGGDRHFGQVIVDHINDFIDSAAPSDLMGGKDPKAAANAILFARSANSRYRKAETLATAIHTADLQAAASGSGGNINNALRQQFKQILTNPKKSRGFTKEELAAIDDLVRQGKTEDFLRWVGKAAPGGNGLIGALEILGTVHNPALAVMPVAGMIAKGIADKGTITKAANLQRKIALGPDVVPAPTAKPLAPSLKGISAEERARINAWLLSGAANQNPVARPPLQITVRGGQ